MVEWKMVEYLMKKDFLKNLILLLEWREEVFNIDISPMKDIVDDEREEKEIVRIMKKH